MTAEKKSSGRGRKKSSGKQEEILDAAIRLFLEKGYNATTTNDVCREANITKPSLYYYFDSKRRLFYDCHMRSIRQQLEPYLNRAESIQDARERIEFMVRQFTNIICEHPELRILIHETFSIKDHYFREIRSVWKRHYTLLKETIAELQTDNIISMTLKSSKAALFLLGMMTWITFWYDSDKARKKGDIADSAWKFATSGLSFT